MAGVAYHVAGRINLNNRAHPRHQKQQQHRQRINEESQIDDEPADVQQAIERHLDSPVRQYLHERRDRHNKGAGNGRDDKLVPGPFQAPPEERERESRTER